MHHTCMTALDSMGTGLLSMVLRLLSSLCQETEGRGSPDAWHSRLMGSPTLTCTGPAGVTVATGDSEGADTKYRNGFGSDTRGNPSLRLQGMSDDRNSKNPSIVSVLTCHYL